MTRHDPMVFLHHMLDHTREAVDMTRGRTRADLDRDRMLNLALVQLMEVIGETASRVPEEFRPATRKYSGARQWGFATG